MTRMTRVGEVEGSAIVTCLCFCDPDRFLLPPSPAEPPPHHKKRPTPTRVHTE